MWSHIEILWTLGSHIQRAADTIKISHGIWWAQVNLGQPEITFMWQDYQAWLLRRRETNLVGFITSMCDKTLVLLQIAFHSRSSDNGEFSRDQVLMLDWWPRKTELHFSSCETSRFSVYHNISNHLTNLHFSSFYSFLLPAQLCQTTHNLSGLNFSQNPHRCSQITYSHSLKPTSPSFSAPSSLISLLHFRFVGNYSLLPRPLSLSITIP